MIKVAVITGGHSSERDISFVSAAGVMDHLDRRKYAPYIVDSASYEQLLELVKNRPDIAFIAQHGERDEDGKIQGFLESIDVKYTGSGVLASALAMDKARCKEFVAAHRVRVPKSITLRKGEAVDAASLPKGKVVVKPNAAGSSDGLSIVYSHSADLPVAIARAFEFDHTLLIEEYIEGTEITVGVLGNDKPEALPIVEILPKKGVFDREAKYTQGATEKICPARLPDDVASEAQKMGLTCHTALGCLGMSRTDMIVTHAEPRLVYMLETNTIPGLTPTSLLPYAAKQVGLTFSLLLDKLIDFALEGKTS